MKPFRELLISSAEAHGHLCPGQVVGVRMAMLGCRLIGLDEPSHPTQIKNLIVYVEMDRCTADAVSHVTGARLGRRSLKFMDYGIMAATFVNLETDRAYRVLSTEEARDMGPLYAPEVPEKALQQLVAYQRMPDSVLFRVQKVDVSLNADDLPGPTRSKATCALCGQVVRDRREVVIEGVTLCRPCGRGAYFKNAQDVAWSELDWTPDHPSPVSRFDFHSCPKPTLKARPWCERVQGLPRNSRLRPRIGMTFQVRRPLAFSKGKGSIRCLLNQPLWVLAPRARAKTSER